MEYLYIAVLLVLFVVAIWFWKIPKKKRIKACDLQDFDCIRKNIHSKKVSDKEKIIDYDKLYHKILLKAWYQWTFWDILKSKPKEIQNINKIWNLHKIRNHLVHEIGSPKWVSLFQIANDYKKEVYILISTFNK